MLLSGAADCFVLLPAGAAETGSTANSSEKTNSQQSAADSNRRHTLKGSTQVIEYKLTDLASYREGIAALDRKNFSLAEGLFKAAAAQLDESHDKYRGQCIFYQGKCLVGMGKTGEAINVLKAAVKLFDQHDPKNPYRASAVKQIAELSSGKAKMDTANLHGATAMQSARISVDQHITLATGTAKSDSNPLLLRVDRESVSKTVYNCFADMTCLETAEIGSNINNAVGRWHPLLLQEDPAAFNLGSSSPVVNVKVSGVNYKINLPSFQRLRKILLATDGEKILAMELDSYDSWLLRMKRNKDGSLQSVTWAKLTHVKDRSNSNAGAATVKDRKVSRSSGFDSKPSSPSGWQGSGSSGWSNKPNSSSTGWGSSRSRWGNNPSGSSWGSVSNGSYSEGGESHRHFSRERRGGGTRGSSGF